MKHTVVIPFEKYLNLGKAVTVTNELQLLQGSVNFAFLCSSNEQNFSFFHYEHYKIF
jgi:hypothetical protein